MKKRMIAISAVLCIALAGTTIAAGASRDVSDISEDKLIRNDAGNVVGVDITDLPPEEEYVDVDAKGLLEAEQFEEYEKLGLTFDEAEQQLCFAGMEVESLTDEYEAGKVLRYLAEIEAGEADEGAVHISVEAVRDEKNELQYFTFFRILDAFY